MRYQFINLKRKYLKTIDYEVKRNSEIDATNRKTMNHIFSDIVKAMKKKNF